MPMRGTYNLTVNTDLNIMKRFKTFLAMLYCGTAIGISAMLLAYLHFAAPFASIVVY